MSTTVMRSATFSNTLGLNTHIPYTDGGYANISNVIANIKYLGIDQVREGISNGYAGSAPIPSFITVAQSAVHFTFCLNATTTAGLQADIALVDQVNEAVPGSVTAVEGPNEINNAPVTYSGVGGLQGALNLQTALYGMVHADPNLSGVAVDYFTGYDVGSVPVGPNPATTPSLADYDNQHPYPNNGNSPEEWVIWTQALPNEPSATDPAVYTETGYSTNGGTTGDVNQDVQAKYTLDLLMDDAKNGIAHTDLYQLMDAYQPGSPQGDDGFGLFDPNDNAKEAETAIHTLTAILADPGANAATFKTTPLDYSLSGLPTTGNSMELQTSDGATDIVVWNEPEIWDEATGTELTAPTEDAKVELGATHQTVKVFDPLSGTSPIETLSNVSSLSLYLTDHPLIVEVEPNTVTPPPTGTIALNICEDAWEGDAEFTVKINGQEIGGDYTASALHASGDAGTFSLTGDWGAGVNDVEVSFINDAYGGSSIGVAFVNDAYGGSPSEDRNLYIQGVTVNGTDVFSGTKAQDSDGTSNFTATTTK